MTVSKRILSGSAASWSRILITIVSQVFLIPLYLSYWTVDTLGVWLAIQGLITLLTTVDLGFQLYMEYEFLKIGKNARPELSLNLSSAVINGLIINIFQLLSIVLLAKSGLLGKFLGLEDGNFTLLLHQAKWLLFILGLNWVFSSCIPGLISKILSPFGYYPRVAWWNVTIALASALATAVAVLNGSDIIITGIYSTIASILVTIFFCIDLRKLLIKEGISYKPPSIRLAFLQLKRSIVLSGNIFLELLRQQGTRLLLAPLVGITQLAIFSTTRTLANFSMQGLHTIMNPLMPELMNFIHTRDRDRYISSNGLVWLLITAIICPFLIILQAYIDPIFQFWTRGKITLDPWLFAMLSQTIVVYALNQPALAIIKGNNILKPQIIISVLMTVTVILSIFILVPIVGLKGAAGGLLLSECLATMLYQKAARNWLNEHGMSWPGIPFRIAINGSLATGLFLILIISFQQYTWIIIPCAIVFAIWNSRTLLQSLPEFANKRFNDLLLGISRFKPKFLTK